MPVPTRAVPAPQTDPPSPRPASPHPAAGPRAGSSVDPSIIIPVYVVLVTVGFFVFQGGWATLRGNEMSRQQSLFAAVNAATLTGFQQARAVNEYTAPGQVTTFVLMLAGILFSWIVGGMAVVRIAKLRFSLRAVGLTAAALILVAAGVGAAVGRVCYGATWPGVYQAVGALGNCGLWIRRPPAGDTWQAMLLLLPAVLGALGLPVLLDCATRPLRPARWSTHSQTAVGWSAGVYLLGVLLLWLCFWLAGNGGLGEGWRDWLATASRESLNARSAGLPFQSAAEWPRAVQWIIMVLMVIGACPGGSGGGLKVTTLAVVCRGLRDSLAGQVAGRLFAVAGVWVLIYGGALLATVLVLVTTEPQMPGDRVLFLAASALGNVGLSHDTVVVSNAGLYALSVTMLIGRVLPVLVLWTLADEATGEPRVAVG